MRRRNASLWVCLLGSTQHDAGKACLCLVCQVQGAGTDIICRHVLLCPSVADSMAGGCPLIAAPWSCLLCSCSRACMMGNAPLGLCRQMLGMLVQRGCTFPMPARSSFTCWSAGSSEMGSDCPAAERLPAVPVITMPDSSLTARYEWCAGPARGSSDQAGGQVHDSKLHDTDHMLQLGRSPCHMFLPCSSWPCCCCCCCCCCHRSV